MFDITLRNPLDPVRDLMGTLTSDLFFTRMAACPVPEDGTLAVDVAEGDGEVIVRASLPGFKKEDIDVQIHNGVLSIKAERSEEEETEVEHFYRKERRVGSLSRRIALPDVVSGADAHAEVRDGVLTVRIPQAEAARSRQIHVN